MTELLRYYLDVNVSVSVATQLGIRGIDALSAFEAGHAGQAIDDKEQLRIAQALNRVFVTHDRDFIVLAAECSPHPGVILLQRTPSIGATVEYLDLTARVVAADDIRDRLLFCDW